METPNPQILNHPAVLWLTNDLLPSVGGNMSEAARQTGISDKTLRALERGTYKGDIKGQLAKLDEQRVVRGNRAAMLGTNRALDYIPTQMMQRIHEAFDAAKITHMVNFVAGQSQIGKSNAARAYKLRYPETTILVEVMTTTTPGSLLADLLLACSLPVPNGIHARFCALRERLTERNLIIVDEAHNALETPDGLRALDVLRSLFNQCGCGVALIVTDKGAHAVAHGKHMARLEQFTRRGEWAILPAVPSDKDVFTLCSAYGLPEPSKEEAAVVKRIKNACCFGQLIRRLNQARYVSEMERRPISWADFFDACTRLSARPA